MNTVITIGRQFGSGGKEIGIRVAKDAHGAPAGGRQKERPV